MQPTRVHFAIINCFVYGMLLQWDVRHSRGLRKQHRIERTQCVAVITGHENSSLDDDCILKARRI